MKRFLAVFMLFSMLLYLSACTVEGEYPPLTTTNVLLQTQETTLPDLENTVIPNNMPMLCVSLPVITETETATDGNILFKSIYQNMSLILPDQSIADRIILDFLNRVDSSSGNASKILEAAKENYSANEWTPYLCQIAYEPMRIDPGVLSLFGHYASYSGSPHPETEYLSVTYDLLTGTPMYLSDIFPDKAAIDSLINLVVASLEDQKADKMLFDDYADTVKGRIQGNYYYESSWYFNGDGLCFYFSPYEIAPYASGIITAQIPYDKLAGLMNDAYFPSESDTVTGQLTATLFDESALQDYKEFSEITIDENGSAFLLSTDSAIYDIRIETGYLSTNGDVFTSEHTVFAANILTQNSAVVLKASTSTHLPNLRISYRTGNEIAYKYLSVNNENIHITAGV